MNMATYIPVRHFWEEQSYALPHGSPALESLEVIS